jgi:hypothetical protein
MSRKLEDWISAFVRYTDNTEPPRSYRRWSAISAIAAGLRRKVIIPYGDFNTWYPNMYIVLVGPAGARKTTAMSLVEPYIRQAGINISSDSVTQAAIIQELEEGGNSAVLNDGTISANLTIFSKEFAVFLGNAGNNLELIQQITDWFDCPDTWDRKTKGAGVYEMYNIFVNLLGATTPTLIRESLTSTAIGGGLASRIIFVYENKRANSIPFPKNLENPKLKDHLIHDYELIAGLKGEVKFSKDFIEYYSKWYKGDHVNSVFAGDRFLDGYSARRAVHLVKLSVIISASESNKLIVTKEHIKRAEQYLVGTERNLSRVFEGVLLDGNNGLILFVEDAIRSQGYMSLSDIWKKFYRDFKDPNELGKVLNNLVAADKVTVLKDKNNAKVKVYVHNDNKKELGVD